MFIKIISIICVCLLCVGCKKRSYHIDNMMYIEKGRYNAGTNSWTFDSGPEHTVYIPGFYISRKPIDIKEYMKFVNDTGYKKGIVNELKHGFSYQDACSFIQWIQKKTGRPYRLPTEYEWEKAMAFNEKRKLLYVPPRIKEWCLWPFEGSQYNKKWEEQNTLDTNPLRWISEVNKKNYIYERETASQYIRKNCSFRLVLPEKKGKKEYYGF